MSHNPHVIRIVEVGPRDGLQNEPIPVPTEDKLAFITALAESGLSEIEATSFVSPKWVPQLGDAAELWPQLPRLGLYSALVPNAKGLERALDVGVGRIAVFTAASDAFTKRNINMTVAESLEVFRETVAAFRSQRPGGWVRGYVSTVFECPYAGRIEPGRVAEVVRELVAIGANEISLGDTIGVGAPHEVNAVHEAVQAVAPLSQLAWHFHDTRGTAIANVWRALELGYTTFDASAGGLGGCPYAVGAGGNLATEDLVYLLHRSGLETGVDVERLARASLPIIERLGRTPSSKVQVAVLAGFSKPE